MHILVCGAAPEAGQDAYYRDILSSAEFLVAADAGAEWAAGLGRVPDVAVGDFDSAVPGAPERLTRIGVEVVTFPAAKDASDLDLTLAEARSRGADRVTLTAVSSLRLDHTLSALGALGRAADLSAELDEPSLAAWALDGATRGTLAVEGPAGALLSVFAFAGAAEGVTLTGMRFPLTDARLEPLSSRGLSNELKGGKATVTVVTGRVLLLSPGIPSKRAARAVGRG